MSRTRTVALAIVAAAALSAPAAARGQSQYVITKIADTAGPLGSPANPGEAAFGPPAINNAGDVAFWAKLDDGTAGVFRARGGGVAALANSAADNLVLNDVYVDINAAGTVAFNAGGPQFGVYTATGTGPLARHGPGQPDAVPAGGRVHRGAARPDGGGPSLADRLFSETRVGV